MRTAREQISKVPWYRENEVSEFIPYQAQIDENTIKTSGGDYLQVVKMEGVAHETADPEDIFAWKNQLNNLLRNMASSQVSLWVNIIRRETTLIPGGKFQPGSFDNALNAKYMAHIKNNKMMVNELYITIIYRPSATKTTGFFKRLEKNKEELRLQQKEALEKLSEIVQLGQSSLARYRPRLLGTYLRKGVVFSEVLEFLDYLVNGDWVPRALPKKPINECLARSRVFFGAESFEIRRVADSTLGACLGILEYPEQTEPGLINSLLSAPFPFILTQSFCALTRSAGIEKLSRQRGRLQTTDDMAQSQINAIEDGADDLASGRIVLGEHHLVLTIFANTQRELRNNLSMAHTELSESGLVVAREDLALGAAYWSQLPGNASYRPYSAPISSKNFAGFCSLHNYLTGRPTGNQWGPAVTVLKTSSGAPFFFNFHEALDGAKAKKVEQVVREKGVEALIETETKDEQKALGNTLIIGPSGSGKTVVQGFLMSQSRKFGVTQVVFDKDRGLEIFVRASGGVYLPLENGKPTGFNPFQQPPTEENLLFLSALVRKLCGGNFTANQEKEIDDAVRGVMGLPKYMRRISRCMEFLDPTERDGPAEKLSKWIGENRLAWVFDNDSDNLDFESSKAIGFDVTEFLDNEEVRTPVIMYLFHRMQKVIDGRRVQIFMDEFWKLLMDSYFESFAQDKAKVIRKQDGILVMGTQSPAEILKSNIAHTLVEQCATAIYMPNPKATYEHYVEGLHLTEREYELIKSELPDTRSFLIKQGFTSVVAELDLAGFDDELAVISGNTANVRILSRIIDEYGNAPEKWLPIFHERRGAK